MQINGEQLQTIWFDESAQTVRIIDQTCLPHRLDILTLDSLADAERAISSMQVRGAPLIGVTAAYGVYLALREQADCLGEALRRLQATRPTAVNLQWALERCQQTLDQLAEADRAQAALALARAMEDEDVAICAAIGEQGATVLAKLWESQQESQERLNILTHCNAGALATVDWGTALACVYKAAARGIPLHVWVDETRPRNQGAALTCWELGQQGIPHTLIVDNAGGLLMQQGKVDACIVGSDRTTRNGDVCNKVGTYLKALAAQDNGVPFYVALPVSTIDFALCSGAQIPIEERSGEEVSHIQGVDEAGQQRKLAIAPEGVATGNPGFDITPARLVSGLITEHGVFGANESELAALERSLQRNP